jgi:TonB family protein
MYKNVLKVFVCIAILISSAVSVSAQYYDERYIQKRVEKNFAQWMQKGEFEPRADYLQRLKDSSLIVIQKIYDDAVKFQINWKWEGRYFSSELTYDTEREEFDVFFTIYYGTLKSFISTPLSDAKKFKERWIKEELEREYISKDFCFVKSDLYPKIIYRVVNEQTYTLPIHEIYYKEEIFTSKDFKEISLDFNSLDTENEYLRGVVLRYSGGEGVSISKKEKEEVKVEEVDEVIPFAVVEEKPKFQGKDAGEFVKWINAQLQENYPQEALENNIQGTVRVSFTINVDGSLSDIKSLRKVDPILENCVIKLVRKSPKWIPGRQQNKPVNVTYQVPVIFKLQ